MIPKKIHYCWFGRGEKPESVVRAIEGWRKVLPGYEVTEWNEDNFNFSEMAYTREAYHSGNYAFVADVCRLKALYEHGGVYLDTDIEVLRPFDDYLHCKSFLGYENQQTAWIGTGVIGAEKECPWIKEFLDFYAHRHFINAFGHTVRTPNTKLLTLRLMPGLPQEIRPEIFDVDVFCAKDVATREVRVTERTVCVHHFACSWRRKRRTLGVRIRLICRGLLIRYFMRGKGQRKQTTKRKTDTV